ncbi:Serine protein kinase PrkA [Chitinispirillum alkaliphilum]|nr:Serine protein kinase PrkA [Chitinispirillum alkaliphilum]
MADIMDYVNTALSNLNRRMTDRSPRPAISFEAFLREMAQKPDAVLRNVFQVFHDMISENIGPGVDEYPKDPESIHYVNYDCSSLFETDTDRPFFADRIFANRLVNLVDGIRRGAQQNKIYVFNGPPGCGKSTFLNNLLRKLECYANSEEGMRFEIIWRLDSTLFGNALKQETILEQIATLLGGETDSNLAKLKETCLANEGVVEIPCPSHDHPVLIIPKNYREILFREVFKESPFLDTLYSNKEYHWVFKEEPCTFCSGLYRALMNKFKSPEIVHNMLYARHYRFNRRIGEGVSVFNPGDSLPDNTVIQNQQIQRKINMLLNDASDVYYIYSRHAKTNNGVYALMDIKSHNRERLIELHNIISEGVHKVDNIEENVNSLLLAIMNPEDQNNIKEFRSFSDRIEYINIPYVLDLTTEVKIYTHTFGTHVEEYFLPRVLNNFARIIISSRMNTRSEALLEWIGDPKKYNMYCDENLQLLKMEIYSGIIPSWLTEEDRANLNASRRRRIIAESDREGISGISGRDSIKIFNDFISSYSRQGKLINMSMLVDYFLKKKRDLMRSIPAGFLDSLLRLYNYTVLQEVKESLYYYNEKQIERDILNYIFAINFEPPANEVCTYTGENLKISEEFFRSIENRLIGSDAGASRRWTFREQVQKDYTSKTLTQDLMLENKAITETDLFKDLYGRYVQSLKKHALDPFLDNENFRRAIKDYDTKDFKTYDKRIRDDVRYLIRNLRRKFGYTQQGSKEVCIYVIDNDLARKYDI